MIACVRIPYFAVTLARRDAPAEAGHPLLVMRYKGGRGKVVGACAEAEAIGVVVGMAANRARALCPQGHVSLFAPGRARHALDDIFRVLSAYSQWLEAERDGLQTQILYLDLGKLRPSDGRTLAAQMVAAVGRIGFAASVGLAAGKFTALIAAQQAGSGAVNLVNRGGEAAFLAPFSVNLLPLDGEQARRLDLLGLRQMGQLAALPVAALMAQFGRPGERLHRLANGEDARRVARYSPPVTAMATRQFEPALENRLTLGLVVGALATRLMADLTGRGLSAREVTLTVRLENRAELEERACPRALMSSGAALGRAAGRLLEKMNIPAGVVEVLVQAGRLTPTPARQLSLFEALDGPDPRQILIELAERYGENCFYSVSANPLGGRLPEVRFVLEKVEAA